MKIFNWIKRWKWLFLGAILLLLGGIAWFHSHQLRMVCQIETNDRYLIFASGGSGFLIRTGSGTADFYDWHGKKLWSVKLPDPDWTGWKLSKGERSYYAHSFSLSSDGFDLVVSTPHGSSFLIQHWHNGKLLGDVIIPCMHTQRLTTKTECLANFIGDHHVLIQILESPKTTLALLDYGQLLTSKKYDGVFFMAADGRHLIDTQTELYYLLVIKNRSFSLHPVKFSPSEDDFCQSALANDTLTIDPPGPSKPWTMHIPDYLYPMSNGTMGVSDNGQYVAFLYYRRLPEKVLEYLVRLRINTDGDAYQLKVGIYNCKGKPVATKTLRAHYLGSEPMWVEPVIYNVSPDGKAVLLGDMSGLRLYRRW